MKRFLLAVALLGSAAGNAFLLPDFFRGPAAVVGTPWLRTFTSR
jgi:hypothetical protein